MPQSSRWTSNLTAGTKLNRGELEGGVAEPLWRCGETAPDTLGGEAIVYDGALLTRKRYGVVWGRRLLAAAHKGLGKRCLDSANQHRCIWHQRGGKLACYAGWKEKRRYGVRRKAAWKVLPEVATQLTAYPTLRTSLFGCPTIVK